MIRNITPLPNGNYLIDRTECRLLSIEASPPNPLNKCPEYYIIKSVFEPLRGGPQIPLDSYGVSDETGDKIPVFPFDEHGNRKSVKLKSIGPAV